MEGPLENLLLGLLHLLLKLLKRVTSTHTLRISDDDSDNNVAIGKVILTLEALRGGDEPIIPSALPTLQLAI